MNSSVPSWLFLLREQEQECGAELDSTQPPMPLKAPSVTLGSGVASPDLEVLFFLSAGPHHCASWDREEMGQLLRMWNTEPALERGPRATQRHPSQSSCYHDTAGAETMPSRTAACPRGPRAVPAYPEQKRKGSSAHKALGIKVMAASF